MASTYRSALVRALGAASVLLSALLLPAAADAAGSRVRWAPPALTSPQTIKLGTGPTVTKLSTSRDYIIDLPASRKADTVIEGGRNVVIIGGYLSTYSGTPLYNHVEHDALYITGATGTVHVEGLLIDGSNYGRGNGIAISAPNATVQIQNTRIVGLKGSQSGWDHADIVQPYGGVRSLRIDRLTGSTNFQGLTVQETKPIGMQYLSNIDLTYLSLSPQEGGKMFTAASFGTCRPIDAQLTEVYLRQKSGWPLGRGVYPDIYTGGCPARASGGSVSWPSLPSVRGSIKQGPPASGEFVPSGVAGPYYTSPGYG